MAAFISESDFLQITDVIIKNIEGGYFHPSMFKDGRLKYDAVYNTSGETMFGLDRVNGSQLALRSPKWNEFWALIDKENAAKLWPWNHRGGALESRLRTLVGQIMYPWFLYLADKYLSADTKNIVANSRGLKMHFIYAAWNGEGWFRRFSYLINERVQAGERNAQVLFNLAVKNRLSSSYQVIRKSGSKIASLGGGYDEPPSDEIFFIEGIGEIEVPTSVQYIDTEAEVKIFTAWEDPNELSMSQDASQMAIQAVQAAYPEEESTQLLQQLGPILNPPPSPSFDIRLPFLIIKSFDLFQRRFTVLPQISSFLRGAFSTKSKVLQFIALNVLAPQVQRAVAISPNTTVSLESILEQLQTMGVNDPALLSINDVASLVEKIRETGLVVFENVNPLAEIETLLEEERASIENSEFSDIEDVYSCAEPPITLSSFVSREIEKVADQCCDPVEETESPLEIPSVEEIPLMTEKEIFEFVNTIEKISDDMISCSEKKANAIREIQRIEKIREDLYPLEFFLKKRVEFLDGFEKGTLRDVTSFTTSQTQSMSSATGFSITSFLRKNILYPSDKDSSPQYTNQSGINPGENEKYFLIVSEDDTFVKEISAIFKMISTGGSFSKFVFSSENLPTELKKSSQVPKGTLYREFYEKINSVNRVDFLFSEQEQGFLSAKPSAEEILTAEGKEKIERLQIDEEKSAEFLRNYLQLEDERKREKLNSLRNSEYFVSLEKYAREEAATIYGLLKSLTVLGQSLKVATVKKEREKMLEEYNCVEKFLLELEKKNEKQRAIVVECDDCIRIQEENLSRFSQPESDLPVPPAGSDPYGLMPPNPFMPGITKNRYWKEFTKSLQTVSFMPIPDPQHLRKRLFRYYPVGLQIRVPSPPTTLPTLASGIPDTKISIPFPILWKHVFSLNTPAGQFVLWLTYCAPFTVAPYLLFIDENQNFVFLSSAKGKVEIPARSLKWNENSALAKAVIDRIPGLKIPTKSLPPIDNSVDNKNPDDKKNALQEIRNRIKSRIDAIDRDAENLTQKRIEERTKLRRLRERISASLDTRDGYVDMDAVREMIETLKDLIKDKASEMLDFEPFSVPKTTKKRTGSDLKTELENLFSKAKSLKKGGALVETKTVNIEKIFTEKALSLLDTRVGKRITEETERDLARIDRELQERGETDNSAFSKARATVLAEKAREILIKAAAKVDSKAMGFVEVPVSLMPHFLPEPARAAISIEPMPAWMPLVSSAVKKAADSIVFQAEALDRAIGGRIDLGGRLPRVRDLLSLTVISAVNVVLNSASIKNLVPLPGWPREISYPAVNMVKQAVKDASNSIWKMKFRLPSGGIPPIKVSPEMIKNLAMPVLDASLNLVFARILQEFSRIPLEQNASTSIKLQQTLQFTKSILGNDVWDINEQDVKRMTTGFVRDALQRVDSAIESTLQTIDSAKKTFNSILKKLAPFSKQRTEPKEEPSLDVGGAVATAFFKMFTAKFVSGELPSPPYPVVLLGCATGIPGWTIFTKTDPLRAVEKLPPYERISLKNVPFVIFLDMMVATAQRYGGIGSNYVTPYFIQDAD